MKISIDAMGGDFGPSVTVPASLYTLARHPKLEIMLVGNEDAINQALRDEGVDSHERIQIVHASEVVGMDESPSMALKKKKDSSMRVALDRIKKGEAHACVSAGNTGALMATARFVLRMLPGIDRPAICNSMPGIHGSTHLLDLGANVDSSADQLLQFAVMGSILVNAVDNKESPSIGLLNIGEEEIKGNERVKQTAAMLNESGLNYVGYVEGDDIWKGEVDVIVCDGFVGNVALKSSEGVAKMLTEFVKEEFTRNWLTKISALLSRPVLKAIRRRTDPRRYNGASLLGLNGIVIKSHGGADKLSFAHAIEESILELEKNVPEKIRQELEVYESNAHIVEEQAKRIKKTDS